MYKTTIIDNERNMLITKTDIYTTLPIRFWLKDVLYFEIEKRMVTAYKADGTMVRY